MTNLLPSQVGLPPHFAQYRPNQVDVISSLFSSPTRYHLQQCPTGFGKSATAMSLALMYATMRHRTAYLIGSKGLQRQLISEFGNTQDTSKDVGLKLLQGKSNYQCIKLLEDGEGQRPCTEGQCNFNQPCEYKELGCHYYDAIRTAVQAHFCCPNYSMWMASAKYQAQNFWGLGYDAIICDEAHTIEGWLESLCNVILSKKDIRFALEGTGEDREDGLAKVPGSTVELRSWARKVSQLVGHKINTIPGNAQSRRILTLTNLQRSLAALYNIQDDDLANWIIQPNPLATIVSPIWPSQYAKRYLFLNTPKVVLSTAWMPKGYIRRLGIEADELTVDDVPSTFPTQNRPFYYIPTHRYNWKTFARGNEGRTKSWAGTIDQFVEPRVDRWKGIIQCSSYTRAWAFKNFSKFGRFVIVNKDSKDLDRALYEFRNSTGPCILATPSVKEGHDFKDEDARWQVISTVPWPNIKDPLIAARMDQDKEYLTELVSWTVLQMYGRIVRTEVDWGETAMFDEAFGRFWKYLQGHAPGWFRVAMHWKSQMPRPLGEIRTQGNGDSNKSGIRVVESRFLDEDKMRLDEATRGLRGVVKDWRTARRRTQW